MNIRLFIACVALLGLVACTSAPIRNVPDTPATPGLVTGRLDLRGHRAVVDVKYSAKDYSITYKDSTNLDYTGTQIHKNYNGWIENLDRDIRANLLSL